MDKALKAELRRLAQTKPSIATEMHILFTVGPDAINRYTLLKEAIEQGRIDPHARDRGKPLISHEDPPEKDTIYGFLSAHHSYGYSMLAGFMRTLFYDDLRKLTPLQLAEQQHIEPGDTHVSCDILTVVHDLLTEFVEKHTKAVQSPE